MKKLSNIPNMIVIFMSIFIFGIGINEMIENQAYIMGSIMVLVGVSLIAIAVIFTDKNQC